MTAAKTIEHSIEIDAPPEWVFRRYRDVSTWSEWDPDTKKAWIEGDFAVGVKGRLIPSKGMGVPMVITDLTPDRAFTAESKIPLRKMRFIHTLEPTDGGVVATHKVELEGSLLWIIGRGLSRQIDEGLPVTLASLKALVESEYRANAV